jgi:hypothetical protein
MKQEESGSEADGVPESLDISGINVDVSVRSGKRYVRDPVRRQWVRLTPEEWVRQFILGYLIGVLRVPPGLIAVEKEFVFNGMTRRADAVIYDRNARPLILVECKAPGISLNQAVFDQVGRYNAVIGAPFVLVSNGERHFCYRKGDVSQNLTFLSALPEYEELILDQH